MLFNLDCKEGFRPKLLMSLTGFGLLSLLLCSYTIGSSYLSVSGYGDWALPGQELVTWLCLLSMMIMVMSLVGLCFSKIRCTSMAVFLGSGLLVALSIVSLKSADKIRLDGFERLSREAVPLVSAIHAYNEKFGYPPNSLKAIKIEYPEGHVIKGGDLPDFKYLPGSVASDRYHGNPWVLMLETPTGPLRWDQFLYYPLQNYPPLGHGGWFEKVGEWAYVHE
jgi:hypothetical protein